MSQNQKIAVINTNLNKKRLFVFILKDPFLVFKRCNLKASTKMIDLDDAK